ncbi:ComF family protein [Cricetibacter osteomyelitidis]|uniref:ComF family protein n=1 Tax=Cricetibacter osteomyelitidis TaxID=1521931 RepID=A0A4V2T0Z6_9PAST|nr:amidophosphoribosyltransferase [Cricetibacter osteomyelitidis]TCP91303.1 ComF family protein [Cricetibacter osteomyelitidis]
MNWLNFCCVECQQRLNIGHHGLCSKCNKKIQRVAYCAGCGVELPYNAKHCGHCLRVDPLWDHLVVVGKYREPLSALVHRFKFQNQFWLDRTLGRLLLLAVHNARRTHQLTLPDMIMPVPLHHLRQWRRGYNQADLLAKQIAQKLDITCRNDLLIRLKNTHTQRGLTAKERRCNLKNAFAVNSDIRHYQSVALVDDVITTGATLNEISKQLRKAGVRNIQVWGLCRV